MNDPRRAVPRTDAILADPRLVDATSRLGRQLVRDNVTDVLQHVRNGDIAPDDTVTIVIANLPLTAASLHPVINATGVLIHTNLGRAPLSTAAQDAIVAASGYTDVELDLATGKRAPRGSATLDALRKKVHNAEAVHLTNNNAAALVLAATTLAQHREIIISRGEFIEIGDRFRLPDLLESTGAKLREVGTTNRTSLDDYRDAINADTAFILKIHPSNFVQSGFVSHVPMTQLATLPVPTIYDIGSGLLKPHPKLPAEPDAITALRDGAALVTASGDKLLGGPQVGIMLGTAPLIDRLKRHPLARALRVDKLTLAALEATLTGPPNPISQALDTKTYELTQRAATIVRKLVPQGIQAEPVTTTARIGGGGAPDVELPSAAIAVPEALSRTLRLGQPSVVGRHHDKTFLLDLFAVAPEHDDKLTIAIIDAHHQAK